MKSILWKGFVVTLGITIIAIIVFISLHNFVVISLLEKNSIYVCLITSVLVLWSVAIGMVYCFLCKKRDIKQKDSQSRILFNHFPEALMLLSTDFEIIDTNKKFGEFSAKFEKVAGKKIWDISWWSHAFSSKELMKDFLDGILVSQGREITITHYIAGKNLNLVHRIVPISADGDVKYILDIGRTSDLGANNVVMMNDIDLLSRHYFDYTSDGIIISDLEQGIVALNLSAKKLLQIIDTRDLYGHSLLDFTPEMQDGEESTLLYNELLSTTMAIGYWKTNWILRDHGGNEHQVELITFKGVLHHGDVIYFTIRDISEIKEKDLNKNRKIEELNMIIDSQNELIKSQSYDLEKTISELDMLYHRVNLNNGECLGSDLIHMIKDALNVAYEGFDHCNISIELNSSLNGTSLRELYPKGVQEIIHQIIFRSFLTMINDKVDRPSIKIYVKNIHPYNSIKIEDNRITKAVEGDYSDFKAKLIEFGGGLAFNDKSSYCEIEILLPAVG